MEMRIVDVRVSSYLGMVRNISMRELAANDIMMFGERSESRGHDLDIVRDARIMISVSISFIPLV